MTPLAVGQLIAVNVFAWLLIHLAVPYVVTLLPPGWFAPGRGLRRVRRWERGGKCYERWCAVRRWKDAIPDGAALFRTGFRKKRLASTGRGYLERFVRETCRGELAHWIVLSCAGLFFLWNPWRIGLVMVGYALLANLPCIIALRYNRGRLLRIAGGRPRRGGGGPG